MVRYLLYIIGDLTYQSPLVNFKLELRTKCDCMCVEPLLAAVGPAPVLLHFRGWVWLAV